MRIFFLGFSLGTAISSAVVFFPSPSQPTFSEKEVRSVEAFMIVPKPIDAPMKEKKVVSSRPVRPQEHFVDLEKAKHILDKTLLSDLNSYAQRIETTLNNKVDAVYRYFEKNHDRFRPIRDVPAIAQMPEMIGFRGIVDLKNNPLNVDQVFTVILMKEEWDKMGCIFTQSTSNPSAKVAFTKRGSLCHEAYYDTQKKELHFTFRADPSPLNYEQTYDAISFQLPLTQERSLENYRGLDVNLLRWRTVGEIRWQALSAVEIRELLYPKEGAVAWR